MDVISKAAALGRLRDFLASAHGVTVEVVLNLAALHDIVEAAHKPYLTPLLSPVHNDFTRANVLWLVGHKDDQPMFLGGARLEDLGHYEDVREFWGRVFQRHYGARDGAPVVRNVDPDVSQKLVGKLAYFGDLFVSPDQRGSVLALRAFVAIGHLAVSLQWDPDWTYCFVREKDIGRGAARHYGFPVIIPEPFEWVDPPSPRHKSEYLVALPRQKLRRVVEAVVAATAQDLKSRQTTSEE